MRIILLSLLILLLYLPVHAQKNKGLIAGKVTDINGLPLSNIHITLRSTDFATRTDEKGNYFLKAPASKYDLIIDGEGYDPTTTPVNIDADKTVNVSVKLSPIKNFLKSVTISGVKAKSAAATKTLLQIQDIPQSIVVIGQRDIQQQAAFDLTTITRNISGINFTGNYGGAGSAQYFNARGFDLNDAQSYRLNGVMIWNLGNNYSDNIEQVEFLKGPTSILVGDVAPGGIMNFVTKRPLADFMADVNLKTGSWGLVRPAIDITGPLNSSHTLRFRVNTSYDRSNSFRDHVSSYYAFIAPTIAWDITPKLSLDVETVFKKSRATDDAGLVSPDGTTAGLQTLNPSLYLGEPARNYLYNDQSYFAKLNYELSKRWRLRATGFFGNTTNRPFGLWFDQPDAAGDFARREYGFYQHAKNGTLAADAAGTVYTGSIKHNILVGVEYQSTSYRYTNDASLVFFDTNNIYHPVYGQTPTIDPPTSPYLPYISKISRTGFYVQDQIMLFNEKLQVLLGARAGRTSQGNHYLQSELAGTNYEGYTDDIVSKNVITPRVGVVYKLRSWSSLYASYSKGYEINSPDIFAQNYLQYATPPATISSQIELGAKLDLLESKMGVTVSLFQIDKHNPYGYVYLDPVNPNYDEYNVYYQGHHRSQGIEIDADGQLLPQLSLTAGAAYTKTKVVDDPGYPTGNVLPNAPKFSGNFWLNYEFTDKLKGLSLGSGWFYKSRFFSSLTNDANLKIPASYTIDAAIGYKYKQMGIQLNVMNLTNQVSYLNPWQFNLFDVKPLRQFVVTLNYRIGKTKE